MNKGKYVLIGEKDPGNKHSSRTTLGRPNEINKSFPKEIPTCRTEVKITPLRGKIWGNKLSFPRVWEVNTSLHLSGFWYVKPRC